jgi:O-antigen/teichoic acid export membrane protein
MSAGTIFRSTPIPPAFVYGISNALPAFAQLLLLPIYGWFLGPSEFGLLSLVQASLFLFQLFAGAPFSAAISRYWSNKQEAFNLKTSAHLLSFFLSSILLLAIFILPFPELLKSKGFEQGGLYVAVLIAGLTALESQYLAALVQEKKPNAYLIRIGCHALGALAGSFAGLYWGENNHSDVLIGRLMGMLIAILPFVWLSFSAGSPQVAAIKLLFRFTLPIVPYLLLSQALLFSDRWTTGILLDEKFAGFLSLGIAFIALNEMAFQAIRNQVQPDIYHSWSESNSTLFIQSARQYVRYALIVYLLSFPLACLALFTLLPPEFHLALSILPWIQAAFGFRLVFILDSLSEFYSPRAWVLSLAAASGLAIGITVAFLLTPLFGFAGCALGFFGARFIIYGVLRLAVQNRKEFYFFSYPIWTFAPIAGYIVSGLLLLFFPYQNPIVWIGALLGSLIACGGLVLGKSLKP